MCSFPLQLAYTALNDGGPTREGPIVRWLKSYNIATLFKLVVDIDGGSIITFCVDFDGLDLSNLEVLDLSIYDTMSENSNVQDIFPFFAQATSLTSLKLYNDKVASVTVYNNFLSYFPVLNSLDVTLGSYGDTTPTLAYPKRLEHLVHHRLCGNVVVRSESVKTLVLSRGCGLGSISSIDCPSLEKVICQTNFFDPIMMIAGIRADSLVKQFGNTDKDFIVDYLKSNTHHIVPRWNIENIVDISVVPMDYITGRNIPIKVRSDCEIVLCICFDMERAASILEGED